MRTDTWPDRTHTHYKSKRNTTGHAQKNTKKILEEFFKEPKRGPHPIQFIPI